MLFKPGGEGVADLDEIDSDPDPVPTFEKKPDPNPS